MAVSLYAEQSWEFFSWLDQPIPVPTDTVKEGPGAAVLTALPKGLLDSDICGRTHRRSLMTATRLR